MFAAEAKKRQDASRAKPGEKIGRKVLAKMPARYARTQAADEFGIYQFVIDTSFRVV